MKRFQSILCLIFLFGCASVSGPHKDTVAESFQRGEGQTHAMLKEIDHIASKQVEATSVDSPGKRKVSPRTISNGSLTLVPSTDWTSGFFAGSLWYLYDYTGNKYWMEKARTFTVKLEQEKWNHRTHDMGFKMFCSYGNGYRLTNDPEYKEILIQSAKTLSTRFHPVAKVIRSWDHSRTKWDFPVIIDNLMNLELLFFATKVTGDSSFYKIAETHAFTTMKNHFREDFSSYHVVDYDTLTGNVLKKNTHQGYSHESAWSRGQAWALYGYTMCFRETRNPAFLLQAEKIATFILKHPRLPADLIPYWDYDAPSIPDEPRDASAAAVTASALYELSHYSNSSHEYRLKAEVILRNLSTKYMSRPGENFGFILEHSTGSKPSESEVDVPLCYADYYFLEALLRSRE